MARSLEFLGEAVYDDLGHGHNVFRIHDGLQSLVQKKEAQMSPFSAIDTVVVPVAMR